MCVFHDCIPRASHLMILILETLPKGNKMMLTYAGAYLKHKGDYFKTNNDKIEVIDLSVTICQ